MNPNKVVLTGYYGCGNLGDEALQETVVAALVDAGIVPIVIAGRDRFRPGKIVAAVRGTAGIVFGGGGLLQNATSSRSLYYYLGLIKLAHALRRPAFLIGQGIGPITGTFARVLIQRVLSRVDYLGVRDRMSREFAAQLGIEAALDGDLYFLNPPLLAPVSRSDPPRIGVALHGKTETMGWKRLFKTLAEYEVVLIPFFHHEDRALAQRLGGMLPHARVEVPDTVAAAEDVIGEVSLLISSRLHPLEFALRAGVPMIAIPRDPKVMAFASEVAQLGGPEITCAAVPSSNAVTELVRDPPPAEQFAATYAALYHRTKAGFERFLTALLQKIGGDDD